MYCIVKRVEIEHVLHIGRAHGGRARTTTQSVQQTLNAVVDVQYRRQEVCVSVGVVTNLNSVLKLV